jgi:hypothetical protein
VNEPLNLDLMRLFKWLSESAKVDGSAVDSDKGKNHGATSKNDVRRSTRLSLQIPVVITCLDPSLDFREECNTVVVNAHGCGVIVHERLKNETPVTVKLVSNGRSKKGRIVLAIPVVKDISWLLGLDFDSPENFWGIETPPPDWCV